MYHICGVDVFFRLVPSGSDEAKLDFARLLGRDIELLTGVGKSTEKTGRTVSVHFPVDQLEVVPDNASFPVAVEIQLPADISVHLKNDILNCVLDRLRHTLSRLGCAHRGVRVAVTESRAAYLYFTPAASE